MSHPFTCLGLFYDDLCNLCPRPSIEWVKCIIIILIPSIPIFSPPTWAHTTQYHDVCLIDFHVHFVAINNGKLLGTLVRLLSFRSFIVSMKTILCSCECLFTLCLINLSWRVSPFLSMFGLFCVFIQLKFLTIWKFSVIHPAFQKEFWHVCEGKKMKSLKSTVKRRIGRNISTDGQLLRTRFSYVQQFLVWERLSRDYRIIFPHSWLYVYKS
jgi:hypothetical protein